jgi:hypothetical protein
MLTLTEIVAFMDAQDRRIFRHIVRTGQYSTSHSTTAQDFRDWGLLSRLEECGQEGRATLTELGGKMALALKAKPPKEAPAQGMAAATAGETGTGSTEGNSPVREADAPVPSPSSSTSGGRDD